MEIICNSLPDKDLLDGLGNISYHRGVTEEDFWRLVGERLAQRRKGRMPVSAMLEKGGPTNKTVQEIESGKIKQLAKLRDYARIVEVDLVDLFRAVLDSEDEALTEELEFVIRQFKTGGVTGRLALVAQARVIEEASVARLTVTPSGREGMRGEKPRAGTSAAKRRGAK